MKIKRIVGMIALTTVFFAPGVKAAGVDLHKLWDNRCIECHGHAGEFSRQFLTEVNGELQGRHHVHDLRRFMQNHYLPKSEVDAVYNMLLAQTQTPPRFKTACSSCHQSAAKFVRQSLQFSDGSLIGRKSGSTLSDFLSKHQALNPEEVVFYTKLLTRVANEVYRP